MSLSGTAARVWEASWPALALAAGLAVGAGITWLGMLAGSSADSPGATGERLAHWARRYCELSDQDRVEAERALFYQLPDRVRVTVDCAR